MKTLATAIALTLALSAPVFASSDDDHEHNSDMKGTEMHGDMMMGHEYMMEMNDRVGMMEQQMDLMQTMTDHLNTPLCGQKWVKTKRGIQN